MFWNSFLGLGTISNFHKDCSVEDSRFFFFLRDKIFSSAIFHPTIIAEASKDKVFAAGNSAEVEEKPRKALPRLQKFNWLQSEVFAWPCPMVIQLNLLQFWECRTKLEVFLSGWWLAVWKTAEITQRWFGNEQMLEDHQLLSIFSLAGPIEFPEVLGSNIQIVLTWSDKRCILRGGGRQMAPGSSPTVSKETGMGSEQSKPVSTWTRKEYVLQTKPLETESKWVGNPKSCTDIDFFLIFRHLTSFTEQVLKGQEA